MNAIETIEQGQLRERPDLRPGLTVRVHVKIREGEKERIQVFEGVVISIRRDARLVQAGKGGIFVLRTDANSRKRDRIDLRNKVRLELRPTLKPTDPGRPRPSLKR